MNIVRNPKQIPPLLRMAMAASLVASTACHAQLGSTFNAVAISSDAVAHHAQGGLLNYRETTDANGIVVHQYVDSSGTVYAVTWRGPAMPDVQSLLGTYFQRFATGASASAGAVGLHAARVADGDLVVENQMRLREFSGRAWLVSALPAGVSTADIQ
ncbi:DUF2844 domain-containing protein [Caballeronia sp. BR00000012568055]|uniref:DUF2844 domain-containing protein n=1 Tax=Caballeronia sp. BR00000012568055 TaxID=2918761 RepID=UPI0023F89E6E|nr:DUF2844 domain-containing protein [Caballeronia sp. BR00000012568055]